MLLTNAVIVQTTDSQFTLIAKTVSGLEPLLANELRALGATEILPLTRAVSFKADKRLMYRANYELRTALRVLKPIHHFVAHNENALYDGVSKFQWHELFTVDQTFAIDAVVSGGAFTHSHYVALRTKDAIVDQFRDRFGARPSIDVNNPDLRISVHIAENQVSLLLDSSGESLHKRGYRTMVDKAPINEVLAAGLILMTGWQGDRNFVDAMCGSGTIPIEAAMCGMRIPAGYYRNSYGFMRWKDYEPALWESVKSTADEQIMEMEGHILGSDHSAKAVEIARANVRNAHLNHDIQIIKKDMEALVPPEGGGILLINPPYGERLEEEDLTALYKTIGNSLKKQFKGYNAWIISSDFQAMKMIGLKPSAKKTVFNGPLECRYMRFDIFEGSYKQMKTEKAEKRSE